MNDALAIVGDFIAAMNADTDGIVAAYRRAFTASTIWDNVGFARTGGSTRRSG